MEGISFQLPSCSKTMKLNFLNRGCFVAVPTIISKQFRNPLRCHFKFVEISGWKSSMIHSPLRLEQKTERHRKPRNKFIIARTLLNGLLVGSTNDISKIASSIWTDSVLISVLSYFHYLAFLESLIFEEWSFNFDNGYVDKKEEQSRWSTYDSSNDCQQHYLNLCARSSRLIKTGAKQKKRNKINKPIITKFSLKAKQNSRRTKIKY
ncbi:uncharacterized protein ASCRUDRAFT_165239 [Ascoidea rubescens DSM 1968]|uniref:Uncharacterized protein n=1 Tax=Ascoidea rubescens DSM 1968 TaxID=1344418 RepID=A0A1D2V8C9_9ASCO|nr:hypothetical protein ASCRUDRAFT_165239 [Ascoidea rubescens DSM 1968]ODV57902.1 hypothetical protein ASCRUDRAFT_165239 [Ascoidea rubescens DSM 1968]